MEIGNLWSIRTTKIEVFRQVEEPDGYLEIPTLVLSLSPGAAGPEGAATLTLAPEPGWGEENLGELPTSLPAQLLLAENIKMV